MSASSTARDKSARNFRLLESRNHPLLKRIRAIIRSGEMLDAGEVLLETPRLIEDAIASGVSPSSVILREPLSAPARELLALVPPRAELYRVPAATFDSLTSTESAPGAVALADAPHWTQAQVFAAPMPRLLLVAGVQDPGNLGTMLRAAEAFGFSAALLTRGTVSPWNAKAYRASAGSALRLPLLRNLSPAQAVQLLSEHRVPLYGAVARGGASPETLAHAAAHCGLAIAVGTEAAGLPPEIERAARPLSIPMSARIDSLNVATAAAIVMYEASRRHATSGAGE